MRIAKSRFDNQGSRIQTARIKTGSFSNSNSDGLSELELRISIAGRVSSCDIESRMTSLPARVARRAALPQIQNTKPAFRADGESRSKSRLYVLHLPRLDQGFSGATGEAGGDVGASAGTLGRAGGVKVGVVAPFAAEVVGANGPGAVEDGGTTFKAAEQPGPVHGMGISLQVLQLAQPEAPVSRTTASSQRRLDRDMCGLLSFRTGRSKRIRPYHRARMARRPAPPRRTDRTYPRIVSSRHASFAISGVMTIDLAGRDDRRKTEARSTASNCVS